MAEAIGVLIFIVGAVGGLWFGLIFGQINEKRHFRQLDQREAATRNILKTQTKDFPFLVQDPKRPPRVFVGEVVIANDTLKKFFASWKKFFGGEIRSYQKMLTRARREALLRLVEQAQAAGYNAVCNVRFESADVTGNLHNRKSPTVAAAFVVATAYVAQPQVGAAPDEVVDTYQNLESPIAPEIR